MPDKGYCLISIRKEVPDRDRAREIYDIVKQRLEDHPEFEIYGQFSNHFDLNEE